MPGLRLCTDTAGAEQECGASGETSVCQRMLSSLPFAGRFGGRRKSIRHRVRRPFDIFMHHCMASSPSCFLPLARLRELS